MNPRIIIAAAGLMLAAAFTACGTGSEAATTVTIGIHYSQFETTGDLTVPAGVPVTFTIENKDPIEHEWIIGSPDVHNRHRTGTEPYHDEIPTEVTVRPYETRITTITFEHAGDYLYVCHLPGHEAYGMSGILKVVDEP